MSKPRSTYVNILMETGVSRRVAYRLVGAAYAAKMGTNKPPIKNIAPFTDADRAELKPISSQTKAGRDVDDVEWPPIVTAVLIDAQRPLGDKIRAAKLIGRLWKQETVTPEQGTTALKKIARDMEPQFGIFAASIVTAAWGAGMKGKTDESMEVAVPLVDRTRQKITWLEGRKATLITNEAESDTSDTIEKTAECIVAMRKEDGDAIRDRKGAPMTFSTIKGAREYLQLAGSKDSDMVVAVFGARATASGGTDAP
ncbi:hypothetical protein JKG47_19050 [Acidithiobacillus sp. MC6.1]|nr:hypothetical protein [Acidithiobacillus sp. MC6.1]